MPTETYSRIGCASLIKEVTPNVPLTPNVFFGFNEEEVEAEYPFTASMPNANNRSQNIRAIKAAIPAPAGTITVNVEPKTFGHFLNGVFGGLTSGRYLAFTPGSGTFQVGETVTAPSASSATVAFVGDGFLLLSSPTGAFAAGGTVTGGTSSATGTITKYDSSVYGHAGILPDNSIPTYCVQFNFADMAIRYMGVRFQGFDALAQEDNIINAGVKIMAQGQFRHAKITAITSSGAGSRTLTMDQTYGLVAGDTIKVYRPSTGAFLDFSASSVKTHTVGTVPTALTITVTNLQTSLAVGDLIVLAPQTPTYSVANEFPWIGGSLGEIGATVSTLATGSVEDFSFTVENDFEERHAANGVNFENRFPAALLQKGLTGEGSMKMYWNDEDNIRNLRTNTAFAVRVRSYGDLIGATALNYEFWFTFPEVQSKPYQTNLGEDAIVDEEIEFETFHNSSSGSLAKCLLVNELTSY